MRSQGQQIYFNGRACEETVYADLTRTDHVRLWIRQPQAQKPKGQSKIPAPVTVPVTHDWLARLGHDPVRALLPLESPTVPCFVFHYRSPYFSCIDTTMVFDFLLFDHTGNPVALEVKGQDTSGSTGQKNFLLIESLVKLPIPSILLLVGGKSDKKIVAHAHKRSKEFEHFRIITSWDDWRWRVNRAKLFS